MDISLVLGRRFPDSEWVLDGGDYSGLTWLSDSQKPTESQLEKLWPTVEAEIAREDVQRERLSAYETTSDPVFFQYQRGDATKQDWLDAVQAVKDAHPYPGE
jgi:hypothetical protein